MRKPGAEWTTQECHRTESPDIEALFAELDHVFDPEIDESILGLGFIELIQVEGGRVTVEVQLPTFWCAANFAYLMAFDIREHLLKVEGVKTVRVRLKDHFASEEVEGGVNTGKSFVEVFPGEALGNLETLRALFHRKGFIKRQERFLRCLLDAGLPLDEVCNLSVGDVRLVGEFCTVVLGERVLWAGQTDMPRRYLERRTEIGLDASPQAPLFTDLEGRAMTPHSLGEHLKSARLVRASLEANSFICEALLSARKGQRGLS
jgi:metal-sulfur cluster biosynthetic enzyme